MAAMKLAQEVSPNKNVEKVDITFDSFKLPDDATRINDDHSNYVKYLNTRGINHNEYPFYASKTLDNRILVPIYKDKKLIGQVARSIDPNTKPKYYAQVQPGTLFNLDNQHWSRKFIILVEGVFDAIAIDGVAILGSEISNKQKLQIESLNRKVIIMPDRDKAGSKLIDQACDWGWSVSMPPWQEGIKDINNAVLTYGKMLTVQAILKYTHDSKTKIKLSEKLWL